MLRRWLRVFVCCFVLFPLVAVHAEDKFFDSNGVKIRYIVEGKGEPVVLIHGFTSTAEGNWGPVIRGLSHDYQVIALDCRGHGKSDKPHDPKMYGKEMGEDVIRLMDHLKIKKAHVAGYSMGGFITYGLAMDHPHRFSSVILGAGGGIRKAEFDAGMKILANSLEQGHGIGPLIIALTPPGQPRPSEEQIAAINKVLMATNDTKALAAVIRGGMGSPVNTLSQEELEAKLKAWKIPTLALVGSQDPLKAPLETLKSRMDALHGEKTPFKLVVIEGANHMTAMFQPTFLKNMKEFLDAHKESNSEK